MKRSLLTPVVMNMFFFFIPFLIFLSHASLSAEPSPEIRTVEVYVPYEEFLKLPKQPDATLMTLEQYRTLVALATKGADLKNKSTELPAIKCALAEAVYMGTAQESVARFDVAFKLTVLGNEWVRCELGALLAGLGQVTLDGEPGWVITDQGTAWLLVKGAGTHAGTLSFSVALQHEEDVQKLASPLLDSASAIMRLEVPGVAQTSIAQAGVQEAAQPASLPASMPIETQYDAKKNTTLFSLALGKSRQLSFNWKRKYDAQKTQALLLAEEQIGYMLDRGTPAFTWHARISIARRKVEELIFITPPGGTVVRLSGFNIHSWRTEGATLHVLLERPLIGDLELNAEGIMTAGKNAAAQGAPGEQFELGCPELKDAREDTRYLALYEPAESRIAVEQISGLRELALTESPSASAPPAPAIPVSTLKLSRLYLLEHNGAKATVRVTPMETVFDTQTVLSATIDQNQVTMRAILGVHAEQGRVYTLLLNVPAPWTLIGMKERGTDRGILSAEVEKIPAAADTQGESEKWTITLSDAIVAAHAFEVETAFRLRDSVWGNGESEWEKRALNFFTPSIVGARRGSTYLAISVHPSIDISFGTMPDWRTESAARLAPLGIDADMLRAGLVTEIPGSEVRMELSKKIPRGEYDLVTHVLTLEREVWVRADIRLAVVDRAVDELTVVLPPEAKDPLYINAPEIKEIAPGATASQRRVRFNRPWQGVRMLRVEYRAPLSADTDNAVPDLYIDGNFDSRRRIVFQSAGVVELTVAAGPALLAAPLEDTLEFARPFQAGRAIFAFTFGGAGDAPGINRYGTYRTHLYERTPTLGNVARELNLTTVLDASGVSRTHASFLLLYSREQYMSVLLPENSKLVALAVDDRSVRPVQGNAGQIAVPLPPRSSARVELVYGRKGGALGYVGKLEEIGPRIFDRKGESIPVGVTNWEIYYPPAYELSVSDGNVTPDASVMDAPRYFALSFWENLFSWRTPRWTTWEKQIPPQAVYLPFAQPSVESQDQRQSAVQGQLVADETRLRGDVLKDHSVGGLAIPEGARLKLSKLGGSARVVMSYRQLEYSRFAARTVFLFTLLIGFWFAQKSSMRWLAHYIIWGLVLGTVIPPALNWQSPLLAIPFCEGLTLLAFGMLVLMAVRGIKRVFGGRRIVSARVAAAILLCLCVGVAAAGESESVMIPYSKDDPHFLDGNPQQMKAYVPKNIFLELMARASFGTGNTPLTPLAPVAPVAPAVENENAHGTGMPNMENRVNLARPAAGAHVSGGNDPQRLIDGDPGTFAWTAWHNAEPFIITLARPEWCDRVRILLMDQPKRFSRYKLEISSDCLTYTLAADHSQGQEQLRGWQTENFKRQQVQSVRLTGTYDSDESGHFNAAELEVLSAPTPVPMALGNARYELSVSEKTWQAHGTLDLATFDPKGWVKVPLDFGPAQLVSVSLDGQAASLSHDGSVPFIQVQGAGKHTLTVELRGPLTLTPGKARLQAKFVGGAAIRLVASLPADVELDEKLLPAGAWLDNSAASAIVPIEKTEGTKALQQCVIDLGAGSSELALSWHSADIKVKGASQIAARHYMQLELGPDGYGVSRAERITIDGSPLDRFSYKVIGEWEISSVSAPDLAEWTVSGEGENKQLRLWFQKPVNAALVQITGWAPLGGEPAQVAALALDNAMREEGFIGLQHGEGRRYTARALEGLKRASSQDLAAMFTLPAENLPDRIYHCHEPPVKILVSAELTPGQVAIETQVTGVIKPDRVLLCVRSRYAVTGNAPLKHEILLPAGYSVRTVRCNAMRTWEIVDNGGQKRLVVYFTSRAVSGTEIIWSAEAPLGTGSAGFQPAMPETIAAKTVTLELPEPRASVDPKIVETLDYVLAADESLDLSQGTGTTMHTLPLEHAPTWVRLEPGEEYHFAFRSAKIDSKLFVDVSRRASLVSATLVSFLRVADDHVQVNVRCRFHIERAGRGQFSMKLPVGARLVSLAAHNLRSRTLTEQADGALLTVLLQSPIVGEQIVDLAYRLPREPAQDITVSAIAIDETEVRQLEQYVGVVQAERGLVMVEPGKGLTKLADSEALPFLPDNVSASALSHMFTAERDWSLLLRQPDMKVETGQAAEVSLAVLKTVIAADGGVRSVATYTVRNRALQFLRIALPPDANLWGVLVDGQPVTVSHEAQGSRTLLLVPIQRMGLTDLPIELSLVYESQPIALPAAYISVTPLAPEILDLPVVETYWQLFVPDDYEVTRSGGNVKDVVASVLVGGKLQSDMNELERLVKYADNTDNSYQKRKALRNVARKQQELNDNCAVLQNSAGVNSEDTRRIARDDLQGQISQNYVIQRQAGAWQQKLNDRNKDLEAALGGGPDAQQQQAFMDNYNFIGNGWRGGAHYKKVSEETPRPLMGEVPLAELRNIQPFEGFNKGELPPPPAPKLTQQTEPLPLESGLREDDGKLNLEKGAADLRVPEKGTKYTFHRVEGHPLLTVTLRSRTSSWHYISLAVLALLGAGAALMRWRRAS